MSTAPPGSVSLPDSSDACALVADGLVERGWAVVPGFIDRPEALAVAAESRALWEAGGFRPAGVGTGEALAVRPEIRRDHVHWLEPGLLTGAQEGLWSRLDRLRLAVNRTCFLGLERVEAHFAVYPPGAFYRRHLDRHRGTAARVVTVILYLNEGWEPGHGGRLRLYLDPAAGRRGEGPVVDVDPSLGTLACFLSGEFWHEVLPANRERLSVTGWFRGREA